MKDEMKNTIQILVQASTWYSQWEGDNYSWTRKNFFCDCDALTTYLMIVEDI